MSLLERSFSYENLISHDVRVTSSLGVEKIASNGGTDINENEMCDKNRD